MMRKGKILEAWRSSASFAWLRAEEELEEEFHFHVTMRIEENLRIGMSPAVAEQDAHDRFGDPEKLRRDCLEARNQSLWYVTFNLVRISLIIALGLSATLALLFLLDRTMVQPLSVHRNPDRLVLISGEQRITESGRVGVSLLDFKDWSARATSFSEMGLYNYQQLQTGEVDRPLIVLHGSEGYFKIVKPRPWIGRTFSTDDFLSSTSPPILLTYNFWKEVYESKPSVIGSQIKIDGCYRTVLGVTDPNFQPYTKTDIVLPMVADIPPGNPFARNNRLSFVLAELLPDVSLQKAQGELDLITSDLATRYPSTNQGFRWQIESLQRAYVAPLGNGLFVLLGAVVSLLLIAIISAARRLPAISQDSSHSTEPLLTLLASLLLAVLLALPVGLYGADLLMKMFLENVGDVLSTTLNFRTVGIAVGVTLLVGLLIALLHRAEHFLRTFQLRRNKTFSLFRYARGLTALQGGLALTSVVCAGLMVGSLLNLYDAELGYQPDNLFSVRVVLPQSQYSNGKEQATYFYQAMQTIEKLPGVQRVSGSESIPLRSSRFAIPFTILDRSSEQADEETWAEFCRVGVDYHQLMGIPLLAGRYFNEKDGARREQVILINRAMAEKFWPGTNPVGKKVWLNNHPEERTIVGIVENVFYHGPREEPLPRIYRCYWQFPANALILTIRTTGGNNHPGLADLIYRSVKQINSDVLVGNVLSNEEIQSEWTTRLRDLVAIVCVTGLLGILLAFLTFRRLIAETLWSERGERQALLPKFKETLWSFFGLFAVGFIGTIFAMQTLEEFLFHISSLFPLLYALSALSLLLLFWFGGIFPARRALIRMREK